jgi:hypothetical protein
MSDRKFKKIASSVVTIDFLKFNGVSDSMVSSVWAEPGVGE